MPTLTKDRPEQATRIAWHRIKLFAKYWYQLDFDLRRLLVSCYLQGVEDTAISLANTRTDLSEFAEVAEGEVDSWARW